ncbi:pilus assembly FimT family protein [Marinicellulosiphila megalodicopiae]|uniref:pilus assembly FimT family protein n=1 Tax=Marinicellulosiphila megalodicopiae TaxID=2724896 RepID=UPI003BAFD962
MSQLSISHMYTQKGFTLIELIMVIVILGILSAFAIPKFADLGDSAKDAILDGARASVSSGNAIAHSASLATNSPTTVTLEGTAYALSNGYPTTATILTIAGISSGAGGDYAVYADSASPDVVAITVSGAVTGDNCFAYTEAASGGASSITIMGVWTDVDSSGTLNAADTCSSVTMQ